MTGAGCLNLHYCKSCTKDQFVKDKYSSYSTGIGKKIRDKKTTLVELSARAEEMGAPELPGSGKQEYLESIVNQILFTK